MTEQLDRAKRYHDAIRDILLHQWDPIGVANAPAAQDEYDGYVQEIHLMLIRHDPQHRLFDHLWWIETKHMGLCGNRKHTEAIANLLTELRKQLEGSV